MWVDGTVVSEKTGIGGNHRVEDADTNLVVGALIIDRLGQEADARLFTGDIDHIKITTRPTADGAFTSADMGNFIPEPSSLMPVLVSMLGFLSRRR